MKSRSIFALLAISATLSLSTSAQGLLDDAAHAKSTQTLSQTPYANLTQESIDAYIEALAFCLVQVGKPTTFDAQQRNKITLSLVQGFPRLSAENQQKLANARQILNQYKAAWNQLGQQQKVAFAYDVLSLAYGEQAAAQALGIAAQSGQGYASSGYGQSAESMMSDAMSCAQNAGCDYNGASGSYDYSTSSDYNNMYDY